MSFAWIIPLITVLISLTDVLCSCYAPPVQFPRCERSLPSGGFQLIPAGLYSNGLQYFIRPLSLTTPELNNFKRPTRQQQSAVVQQVTINQNTAIGGGEVVGKSLFGFGGGRGGRPFGHSSHGFGHSPHGFGHSHGFGRPHLLGGFRGRSYEESQPDVSSYAKPITMPRCPSNYVFSCQPTVTPVLCGSNNPCPYA